MAARSFLLDADLAEGLSRLTEGVKFPRVRAGRRRFAIWLEEKLRARLDACGDFEALGPVVLGSWARHELCPKSDIDLVLTGPEDFQAEFVARAFEAGLKLRARAPADPKDWTVGVEAFDILALNAVRDRFPETCASVLRYRRQILSAIKRERRDRRQRQDSVVNLLEPNLKFGAGGLRDIEQALAIGDLFAKTFKNIDPYAFDCLREIKEQLLYVRALLHLTGSGDVLTAADQMEIGARFHFKSPALFMSFVQNQLERASFYADWILEFAGAPIPQADLGASRRRRPQTLRGALKYLAAEPSILRQFEIRRRADDFCKGVDPVRRGRALAQILERPAGDEMIKALYRTRLLDGLVPDFKKLRGLVQHDHYHRFTADAHLIQTVREVERAQRGPNTLGPLASIAKSSPPRDWWTLKLTALFHDLAKGRGGGHAVKGAKLADGYLRRWRYAAELRQDVVWLVENHLLLSTSAFRQNPRGPETWARLLDRGVTGSRLRLLTLFTTIDIKATNPDAWTEWKATLLRDLYDHMNSSAARNLGHDRLDAEVRQSLPPGLLDDDLRRAEASPVDLSPKVVDARRGREVWVRFHRKIDGPGTFLDFVRTLYGFGLNIQFASIRTRDGVGVYDWFCLRTQKSTAQIQTWLNLTKSKSLSERPRVNFDEIDLTAVGPDEWIFSFRAKDQRGLLLNAAHLLNGEGLDIRWAKAHTWGDQIEDVFGVTPTGDATKNAPGVLKKLRSRATARSKQI